MMVKPSRLASWRATVLLPAPAGPSMATMGAITPAGITRAGTRIKRSGVQRHQQHQAHGGHGGDAPWEPLARRAIRLRELLLVVVGQRRRGRPPRRLDGEHRRKGTGHPPRQYEQRENSGDRQRHWLHGGRKLCALTVEWLVQG